MCDFLFFYFFSLLNFGIEIKAGRSMLSMEESSKKRPFFSSTEELFDEEYYDEQLPEKKRRLTAEQVVFLF